MGIWGVSTAGGGDNKHKDPEKDACLPGFRYMKEASVAEAKQA